MNQEERNDTFINQMASTILGSSSTMAVAGAALLGGALLYYLNNSSKATKPTFNQIIDHKNQSRVVENHKGGARISTLNQKDQLFSFYYEDGKTLYELFLKAGKISNDGDYLGWKPSRTEGYKWLKYSQVNNIAQQLGSAFIELGLEPAKETLIGIYAKNRPEWVITEVACNTYSFVNVPLYDTLGIEAIDFILLQTELKLVVCDDSAKAMQLMNSKSSLEYVVIIEAITEECRQKAAGLNIKLFTFEELKEVGQKKIRKAIPPKPDDLATICFTSGTTGKPKELFGLGYMDASK